MADLSTSQKEILGIISEVVSDASFTVLSMLLGRDIDLAPLRSDRLATSEIAGENWSTIILGRAGFSKGIEGDIFFVFNIADATRLIDLMLGGEGESSAVLDEDGTDALNETINQIMGATCQTLSEKTGKSIACDQVEIKVSDSVGVIEQLISKTDFGGVEFSLSLEALFDSKMFLGLDDTLLNALGILVQKGEPSPAPSVEAPPPSRVSTTTSHHRPVATPEEPSRATFQAPPNIELLMDIELPVVIQIGKTELLLQDILKLTPGAIVELDKTTDDPVDMLVNNKLVARGEVVVVEGNFAFRIIEIVSPAARIRSLG